MDDLVRASEIGHYTYCARAWWLSRVKGYPSANLDALDRGTDLHQAHGRSVEAYHRWHYWAYLLLALSVISGLLWIWQVFTSAH